MVHKNKHTTTKHTCRVSLTSTLHFFTSLSPGGGDKLTSHMTIQGVKCWKISTQTTTIIKVLLYIRVGATSSIPYPLIKSLDNLHIYGYEKHSTYKKIRENSTIKQSNKKCKNKKNKKKHSLGLRPCGPPEKKILWKVDEGVT